MNVAALIVGIDGWEQYTLPLIRSIEQHSPATVIVVIDNDSEERYPDVRFANQFSEIVHTNRLSYSVALNCAAEIAMDPDNDPIDWYIALSNDVECMADFMPILAALPDDTFMGPAHHRAHFRHWIHGWCVAIPSRIWHAVGGWDENFIVSSWEDVDFSTTAKNMGFHMKHDPEFPFRHLDQQQRFTLIENYWDSEAHNRAYFMEKHAATQRPVTNVD